MLNINRIGFTKLSGIDKAPRDALEESETVNIVLVHGLRGHPFKTWASKQKAPNDSVAGPSSRRSHIKSFFKPSNSSSERNNSIGIERVAQSLSSPVYWPKDFLVGDIPQATVWTYGYNADIIGGLFQVNNKNSVSGHSRDLRVRLERDIDNEDPIIFMAHSLGGIIVKDMLGASAACCKRTRLIVFLGTPHRGSALASWGEIASNLAQLTLQDSHTKIVESLKVDGEVLDSVHERFIEIVYESDIRIHSFQEGRGISGMKGISRKVVSDASSKLGLPQIETIESIDANHMQMARCNDRSDENYRFIVGVLKQFLENPSKSAADLAISTVTQSSRDTKSRAVPRYEAACPPTSSYCLPFFRNRRFTGRAEKLKALEERLLIQDDCQKLAIVGLGGVGKSQMALELAYMVKESRPAYSIFWVPAVNSDTFEKAYRDIATQCSLGLSSNEDPKESVKQYLSSERAGSWLLIVDNADDQDVLFGASNDSSEGVASFLPESEHGLTLFTTRHREMAVSLAGSEIIEIQEMEEKDAQTLLAKLLIEKDLINDHSVALELLKELAFLPLAITQAAAYVNTMQISIQEYLSLLRSTEDDIVNLLSRDFQDSTRYKTSRNAVAATWLVSFDQIRRSDPTAADLLSFMSCIEHKAIPRSILPAVDSEELLVHGIGTLRAYAFLTKRADGNSYDMHRLVHLAIKVWLDKQNATKKFQEDAARHLADIFPTGYSYIIQTIWWEYFPHAFHLLHDTKAIDFEARFSLCFLVGSCLLMDGRTADAIVWLSECTSWWQSDPSGYHSNLHSAQMRLVTAFHEDGQPEEALKILEPTVEMQKEVLEEDHPDLLQSQALLASTYGEVGQSRRGLDLLQTIVSKGEETRENNDNSLLIAKHMLAGLYLDNQQIAKARELLEHVVTAREQALDEDHPRLLVSQHELAGVYRKDGQNAKALKLYKHVLAVEENILREDHPDRLTTQHQLATMYISDGQFEDAITLLEHIVGRWKEQLREDHPGLLASQHELARAYKAEGQIEKAITLFEHVVDVGQRGLQADNLNVAAAQDQLSSQQQLAEAYYQTGRVDEAVELLDLVVTKYTQIMGEDDPRRLDSERILELMKAEEDIGGYY